jgi:single-strand DNA-binding protein
MLNRVILIGRLTRDPEMRFTPNGVPVTSFTLAVDRQYASKQGGERGTDFIDIVAWRQLGELCANYLSKGRLAAVEGRLEIQSFEGQDGQKRRVARVIAQNVQFLSPKDGRGGDSGPRAVENDDDYLGEEIPF